MTEAAYRIDERSVSRDAFYATACDPRRHVCVEACAGAGKTWMLVARIVRALLEGAEPHEILAITFTRKAAGEMRTRLSEWLRQAAAMTPVEAAARLESFGLPPAEAQQRAIALIGLYERALDSGRAVEIRTMHAWYAQLLAAAPLDLLTDLGLATDLAPLEDRSDLMPALRQRFHSALLDDEDLRAEHRRLTLRHGRFQLAAWLDAALDRRNEIELADEAGVLARSVAPATDPLALTRVREPAFTAAVRALLLAFNPRRKKAAAAAAELGDALLLSDDRARFERCWSALFTNEGTPRKQLGDPPEQAALGAMLEALRAQVLQQDAHDDHQSMVRLSHLVFAEYTQLKRERGLVDMNDLERVALALLSEHELSGWVQQRLDARVRHLLIDEFQDTSPLQWHALQAWLAAYAGAGGGMSAPRLFIVGDPKQSIYRFRGADPRVFEAAQRFLVEALDGSIASCDHTRRCAPGVVALLNRVFGAWGDAPGLLHWREHTTEVAHDGASPVLASLPSAERPATPARAAVERVWRPSLTQPRIEAATVVREAEAREVARAVAHLVQAEGVPAEDILVLARKRVALVAVADALAQHQVLHVAPEELLLSALPEVQDLLAVLDVLASPTQSLSLARALKSPLFGADDAELLALSRRAADGGGWWHALLACAGDASAGAALQRAARLFAGWSAVATVLPPHDLLDRIVHEGDLLPRLAAAVPPAQRARSLDAVRALLAAALDLDGGRYTSPYAFVRALRSRRVEAPASQQDGAVRLLTIHGAKGLEARIVFLVDAEPEANANETMAVLVDWPVASLRPVQVAFVASHARCPPSLQGLLADELHERAREEANALYVALTRAQQRLFVSRTPPHRGGDAAPSWWSRLEALATPWAAPAAPAARALPDSADVVVLPAPREPLPQAPAPVADNPDAAIAALGQAVHRVLEWAPRAAQPDFAALARAAARAFGVADAATVRAVAERIWASAECRRFFEPTTIEWSGNEVGIAGADGRPRRIDRLVLLRAPEERAWWVLDYKLGSEPQRDPALRAQLAEYRRAVAALAPDTPVRAAFITGAGRLVLAED